MERLSGIFRVGPTHNHKYPFKRQAEGDWTTGRREDCMMETEESRVTRYDATGFEQRRKVP